MLCNQGYYTFHVRGHLKNDLSFIRAFDNDIWYNFRGKLIARTNIFKIQKQVIRIMTKSRSRDSCRQLFKRLEILPLQSQYIRFVHARAQILHAFCDLISITVLVGMDASCWVISIHTLLPGRASDAIIT